MDHALRDGLEHKIERELAIAKSNVQSATSSSAHEQAGSDENAEGIEMLTTVHNAMDIDDVRESV